MTYFTLKKLLIVQREKQKWRTLHFFNYTEKQSPGGVLKKGVLRNFVKFTGKHLCQILFLNKVVGLRPATLLKTRLWHRSLPLNFAKFLRTPLLKEHLFRLLLYTNVSSFHIGSEASWRLVLSLWEFNHLNTTTSIILRISLEKEYKSAFFCSYLLRKSLTKNLIFWEVILSDLIALYIWKVINKLTPPLLGVRGIIFIPSLFEVTDIIFFKPALPVLYWLYITFVHNFFP